MFRHLTLALVLVLAGCAGGGGGEATTDAPPLRATATPATVSPAALDDTGYAERRADTPRLNTTITATIEGDVTLRTTRDVSVTTARRVYARSTADGPAVVALYTVPGVQPFENADLVKNPADALSTAALVTRAQPVYADVRDLSQVGERTVSLLGNETTLTRYRATATQNGTRTVTVAVAVATVAHGDDYVTVVAVTPRSADPPLGRLLGAVRHEKA